MEKSEADILGMHLTELAQEIRGMRRDLTALQQQFEQDARQIAATNQRVTDITPLLSVHTGAHEPKTMRAFTAFLAAVGLIATALLTYLKLG